MADNTADVAIIGAGVVGAGIALELSRTGRRVLVIDKGSTPGAGSTSASSACVRFHYSTFEGVATSWAAKFGWERWPEYLGHLDEAGLARYHVTGVLVPDFPGFALDRVAGLYAHVGIPYEVLGPSQMSEKFPTMDTGEFYPPRRLSDDAFWADPARKLRGLWTPEGGFVDDPQLAAHNLVAAAIANGARTRFGATVAQIRRSPDRVTGVTLADGTAIDAPTVVNAAGPHSHSINALAGVLHDFRISTRPLRQEVHHVPAPRSYSLAAGNSPMVADGDLGIYFRPTPGDGVLVGGQEPACDPLEWLEDADAFNPNPSVGSYEAQTTRLARRLPELAVPPRPKGVVGVYDASDDWIPIYDKTSLPGYYVAIGTSGNQFKNAPVIGQMMARLITSGDEGVDHDVTPVVWTAPYTGQAINLAHFSRLREMHPDSTRSVLG